MARRLKKIQRDRARWNSHALQFLSRDRWWHSGDININICEGGRPSSLMSPQARLHISRVTMALPWSSEEDVIMLYFVSRKIQHEAISDLIQQRGYSRTPHAINSRLCFLRQSHPQLSSGFHEWDVQAIDQYIDTLLGNGYVNLLIHFT